MGVDFPANEFHPELISRRGELIAWLCALLAVGAWFGVRLSGHAVTLLLPILAILLSLAAVSISLGNWMDRQTVLRLTQEEVVFHNGLRHVRMRWNKILQVRVLPAQWGSKVQVLGEGAFFEFHTLGEVKVRGEIKGRIGFVQGETILHHILENAGLRAVQHLDVSNQETGFYYSRE